MKRVTKRKGSLLFKTAVLAVSCYVLVMLIQIRVEIAERNEQLEKLEAGLEYQQQINEDMQAMRDNYESYLEQQAREQGLALPGETIFKEAPGNG